MGHFRNVLCGLIAASVFASGCTTRSYAPSTDAATRELKIKAGDQIRVVTTHRERLSFNVTEVRDDRFVGVTVEIRFPKERRPAGTTVEVLFDELAVLEITRADPTKAAIGVAAVLVTLTAIGAVMSATVAPGLGAAPP